MNNTTKKDTWIVTFKDGTKRVFETDKGSIFEIDGYWGPEGYKRAQSCHLVLGSEENKNGL